MSIDLKKMLEAGVHFGHRTARWDPRMRPFIWGHRNKTHLIDVSKSAFLLERAGKFLQETATQGGVILWVGTKKSAQESINKAGTQLEMPLVVHRWIGGTLSNFEQVKKAIVRLLHLRDVIKKPLHHYKKKEIGMLQKEVDRLEKNVGGIIDLHFPPAAVVIVDAKKESTAVKEAARLGIPVVALVDTNTDPSDISYIIPANDDSPRSVAFVVDYLIAAALEGKKTFTAAEQERRKNGPAEAEGNRRPPRREGSGGGARPQRRTGAPVREGQGAPAPREAKAEANKSDAAPAPTQSTTEN